jgi:hypothetical protein
VLTTISVGGTPPSRTWTVEKRRQLEAACLERPPELLDRGMSARVGGGVPEHRLDRLVPFDEPAVAQMLELADQAVVMHPQLGAELGWAPDPAGIGLEHEQELKHSD